MRSLAVVALLASGAAAGPGTRVPAPAQLVAKPLEVGQWAVYRESDRNGEVGTVALLAVNRAACGMQLAALLKGTATREWIFCIDDEHHLVKATLDGKPVVLREHRDELEALLTRVLPPQFVGAFVREDITVPAGTFEGTERKDGTTTTWLHPAVPLGAVVQVTSGDRRDVLVAYGEGTESIPGVSPGVARPPPWASLEILLGQGSSFDADKSKWNNVDVGGLAFGLVLGRHVDGTFAFEIQQTPELTAMPSRKSTSLMVGPRLWPFREHLGLHGVFDPASLFIQVTAGYTRAEVTNLEVTTSGNGVGGAATVGWQGQWTPGWASELLLTDEACIYGGNLGVRNTVAVMAALELWIQ